MRLQRLSGTLNVLTANTETHLLTRPSLQATLVTHCSNSDLTPCTLISCPDLWDHEQVESSVPAKEGHLHVPPEQNLSDGGQFGGTALHLQTLLLHSHLTQVITPPCL